MTLLIYIIKSILVSGMLYVYYAIMLRDRKIHRFNRVFLLNIPLIGFIIPAFHFSLPTFWYQNDNGATIRLLGVGQGKLEEAVTIYGNQGSRQFFTWPGVFAAIFIAISIFLLIRLLLSILYLRRLPRNKPSMRFPEATVFFVSERGTPFSFFRNIFWDEAEEINSLSARQILRHEIFHAAHKHSADIVWMELLTAFFWFNPFLYLIHRDLRAIHEYTADEYASAESDRYSYVTLLMQNATGNKFPLTHPFFKTHIKRRIAMITQHKNSKSLPGRLLIIPVIGILIGLFSFKSVKNFKFAAPKTIRVIVDPGHGGIYTGASGNGIKEKDLNLLLGRKIKSLSREYNVDVILTRETDENIGDGSLRSSLVNRVELAEKQNADLFISIHANLQDEEKIQKENSGFMIYVPKKENKFYDASIRLGSIMTESLKPDYTIAPELKQRNTGVMVLDKSTVPAILIECGFLDNPTDVKFITDEKNQEKIARDILQGIQKYAQNPILTGQSQIPSEINERADTFSLSNTDKSTGADTIYKKVEVEATYPGGQQAWFDYLVKNLKYPNAAVTNEIQGQVIVEFIVEKNGMLSDIHALSGPQELKEESIRIIKESGQWTPAKNHSKNVDSYHKQPINYKLESK